VPLAGDECIVWASMLADHAKDECRVDVPATAVTDHGKHQPFAWNIGSVQR
jgi:hypothetical protein